MVRLRVDSCLMIGGLKHDMTSGLLSCDTRNDLRCKLDMPMLRKFLAVEQRPQIELVGPLYLAPAFVRTQEPATPQKLWIEERLPMIIQPVHLLVIIVKAAGHEIKIRRPVKDHEWCVSSPTI